MAGWVTLRRVRQPSMVSQILLSGEPEAERGMAFRSGVAIFCGGWAWNMAANSPKPGLSWASAGEASRQVAVR